MAMHIVRIRALGLPKDSKTAFDLLEQAGEIPAEQASKLKKMECRDLTGLRNLIAHDYMNIDLNRVVEFVMAGQDKFIVQFLLKPIADK